MSAGYRVTYNWSAYEDYDSLEFALTNARELSRRPTSDPLQREIRVLDKSVTPHPTIEKYERPIAAN